MMRARERESKASGTETLLFQFSVSGGERDGGFENAFVLGTWHSNRARVDPIHLCWLSLPFTHVTCF